MGEEGSRNNSWHLHSTGAFTQVSEKNKARKKRSGNLGRQKQDLCGGSLLKQRPVPNKAWNPWNLSQPKFAMAPGEEPTHEATRKPHCREHPSPTDLRIFSAMLVRYQFTTEATYLPGPQKEKTADVGYLVVI